MEAFETSLSKATAPDTREILGAIGLVVNGEGEYIIQSRIKLLTLFPGTTLYGHAGGYQTLAPDAAPINMDSTFYVASGGKFICHVAALQYVDRGILDLDDPISAHLPEVEHFGIMSKNEGPGDQFSLRKPTKPVTLRHLLTHSGVAPWAGSQYMKEWEASSQYVPPDDDAQMMVKLLWAPLIFEPGEGWEYGARLNESCLRILVTYVLIRF